MKKALRDILLIVVLFGAILLAPLVIDALSGPDDLSGQPKAQPSQEAAKPGAESIDHDMPPQPEPAQPGDSAMGKLLEPEQDISQQPAEQGRVDAPPAPADCPDYDPGKKLPDAEINLLAAGAKGIGTMKIGNGDVALDGAHFSGMEVIDVRNGEPNKVSILAPGLATVKGRHAYVIGDRDVDTVYLDRCLRWNDPIAISDDGPEPLLRYDAYDSHGNLSYLSVTEGVKVEKQAASK